MAACIEAFVDPAEVRDVLEARTGALDRARGGDEVGERGLIEPILHLRRVGDVQCRLARTDASEAG